MSVIKYQYINKIKNIRPLRDHVIVSDMNFGLRTLSSGIMLLGDDSKTDGIRPRWAKVFAIGPEQKDVQVNQWILVEHGRWTRGALVDIEGQSLTLRRIDSNAILLVSDEEPNTDDNISTSIDAQQKERQFAD